MHDIEPYFGWREKYIASDDRHSPFFGRHYSEFHFTQRIYNYYIHPQWDEFGSETLYLKLLFVDYDEKFAVIELLGEWNDCLNNDIMFLKRQVIDPLIKNGIYKFALILENVLNFHGHEDSYYEEWADDLKDEKGWVCFLNTMDHIKEEMEKTGIHYYVSLGFHLNGLEWRRKEPHFLIDELEYRMNIATKQLRH
ncbi:MAG TPA: hypothetical protein PKC30_15715 [Saprospiraceae bacterium]|nr:hypothetical protein [Saprospiraceae bacterium]